MTGEKRRQRTSFTRSLQKIAERIDRTCDFEVECLVLLNRLQGLSRMGNSTKSVGNRGLLE